MPVPKRKKSKARSAQGRAHIRLKAPSLVICKNCGSKVPAHQVCSSCGYYKGREIVRQELK